MSKFWLIARYEFLHYVQQRRFLLSVVSVPIMVGFFIGIIYFMVSLESSDTAVGFVDQADLLGDNPLPAPVDDPDDAIPFLFYEREEQAQQALEDGILHVYYVITPDYATTRQVNAYYIESPPGDTRQQFWDFIQINLLRDMPTDVRQRLVEGSEIIVRTPDGSREYAGDPTLGQLVPIFSVFGFMILFFLSASYYTQAIVSEKENRTMEIMVTSASPMQIMGGKSLGIFAINMVQVASWILVGIAAVFIGGNVLNIEFLQDVSIPPNIIWQLTVIYLPAYILYAALMVLAGIMIPNGQESQQFIGPLSLFITVPMWVMPLLIETPNHPVAIALSIFPLTAPGSMAMRSTFSVVPAWQIGLSALLTTVSAMGVIWLATAAFRLGMLRYGKALRLADLRKRGR